MTSSPSGIGELLDLAPVIPVIVIKDSSVAVPLAAALVAGSLTVLEVTLRTSCALDAIERIAPGGARRDRRRRYRAEPR